MARIHSFFFTDHKFSFILIFPQGENLTVHERKHFPLHEASGVKKGKFIVKSNLNCNHQWGSLSLGVSYHEAGNEEGMAAARRKFNLLVELSSLYGSLWRL